MKSEESMIQRDGSMRVGRCGTQVGRAQDCRGTRENGLVAETKPYG